MLSPGVKDIILRMILSQVDLAKLYVETLTQAEAGPEEARFQRLSK